MLEEEMRRLIESFLAAAAVSATLSGSASAKLRNDVVPDAETAKTLAISAMRQFYRDNPSMGYLLNREVLAQLYGNVWQVEFRVREKPLGPGENYVCVTTEGGFADGVLISKNDGRVRKVGAIIGRIPNPNCE